MDKGKIFYCLKFASYLSPASLQGRLPASDYDVSSVLPLNRLQLIWIISCHSSARFILIVRCQCLLKMGSYEAVALKNCLLILNRFIVPRACLLRFRRVAVYASPGVLCRFDKPAAVSIPRRLLWGNPEAADRNVQRARTGAAHKWFAEYRYRRSLRQHWIQNILEDICPGRILDCCMLSSQHLAVINLLGDQTTFVRCIVPSVGFEFMESWQT